MAKCLKIRPKFCLIVKKGSGLSIITAAPKSDIILKQQNVILREWGHGQPVHI